MNRLILVISMILYALCGVTAHATEADISIIPAGPPIGTATGYFHTLEENGRWWVVDPLGRAFFMIGADHIYYTGFHSEALGYAPYSRTSEAVYGSEEAWAQKQIERLCEWGFNSLPIAAESMRRRKLPHVETLSVGTSFGDIDGLSQKTTWTGFPNVFSPEWPKHCDKVARERCATVKDDPWVLGYFLDNELEWYGKTATGLFGEAWKKPAGDAAKQAWVDTVRSNLKDPDDFEKHWGVKITSFDELSNLQEPAPAKTKKAKSIETDFVRSIAELYFKTCTDAIKRYDPNHMIFGCRFAGRAPGIWDIAGKYCDVVSFNVYKWIDVNRGVPSYVVDEITEWHEQTRKPMMCTEWSFPALDAGLPSVHGAGMRVDTQTQRAQCFTHFQRMLFSLPFMVGSNFFMYLDEPAEGISSTFPEDSNYGLINVNDMPYPELTQAAAKLNTQAYAIHQKCELAPFSDDNHLAKWITDPGSLSKKNRPAHLCLTTGNLSLEGPIDGHPWRLSRGGVLLGDLMAYIEQDVGNWIWAPSDAARIVAYKEDRRAYIVEMELSSEGKGPIITRLSIEPALPPADKVKPGKYRGVWRFVIPKDDGGWISMQCLQFENSDVTAWASRSVYMFLMPAIGGSIENDKTLFAPDMHEYYLTGAAWVDDGAGAGVGCWFRKQSNMQCTFWVDKLGRYRSDMRYTVEAYLAPGQKYDNEGPLAFYFALDAPTREAYVQSADRVAQKVLVDTSTKASARNKK